MNASEALARAAAEVLAVVEGLGGVHEARPVQAAFPHAVVETGAELDWSHKTGVGREVRLAIVVRDQGERSARVRGLAAAAEAAVEGIGGELEGWRLVSLLFVRGRVLAEAKGAWRAESEYRGRMLKV